jgi:hypothetical protein
MIQHKKNVGQVDISAWANAGLSFAFRAVYISLTRIAAFVSGTGGLMIVVHARSEHQRLTRTRLAGAPQVVRRAAVPVFDVSRTARGSIMGNIDA